jgi:uncharacterized protein DUF4395
MPSAIPSNATASLPPARMIDPRGHRFGAGLSAAVLIASIVTAAPVGIAFVLLTIGVSAAFSMRWSIYGMVWRRIVRAFRLPAAEPEHEYPPRFAQTLGSVALILAIVAFAAGAATIGWILAGAVAALQTLLAVTGYCLGCRLYFLRWWVPSLVTRVWSRSRPAASGIAYR